MPELQRWINYPNQKPKEEFGLFGYAAHIYEAQVLVNGGRVIVENVLWPDDWGWQLYGNYAARKIVRFREPHPSKELK